VAAQNLQSRGTLDWRVKKPNSKILNLPKVEKIISFPLLYAIF
jgi:hypothetical protein